MPSRAMWPDHNSFWRESWRQGEEAEEAEDAEAKDEDDKEEEQETTGGGMKRKSGG